jgi:hypothetical protein
MTAYFSQGGKWLSEGKGSAMTGNGANSGRRPEKERHWCRVRPNLQTCERDKQVLLERVMMGAC